MENPMRRLVPVLLQELSYITRESIKWTLVGVITFVCMWFLTDGVPRVVVIINALTYAAVISPGPVQNDAPNRLVNSR